MIKNNILTDEEKHWIKVHLKLSPNILHSDFWVQKHNRECLVNLAPLLQHDERAMEWLRRQAKGVENLRDVHIEYEQAET
jgi:hypothetical protein